MTAKELLIERAPHFSEAQARAALEAAERSERAWAALETIGDALADADPAQIEAQAIKAAKEARAEIAAERRVVAERRG